MMGGAASRTVQDGRGGRPSRARVRHRGLVPPARDLYQRGNAAHSSVSAIIDNPYRCRPSRSRRLCNRARQRRACETSHIVGPSPPFSRRPSIAVRSQSAVKGCTIRPKPASPINPERVWASAFAPRPSAPARELGRPGPRRDSCYCHFIIPRYLAGPQRPWRPGRARRRGRTKRSRPASTASRG